MLVQLEFEEKNKWKKKLKMKKEVKDEERSQRRRTNEKERKTHLQILRMLGFDLKFSEKKKGNKKIEMKTTTKKTTPQIQFLFSFVVVFHKKIFYVPHHLHSMQGRRLAEEADAANVYAMQSTSICMKGI